MGLADAGKKTRGRALPTFNDAGTYNNEDIAPDTDTNNIELGLDTTNETTLSDIINKIVEKPKKPKKIQVSFYIDEDVAKEFDKFAKRNGKGAKSELLNNFLRELFMK
jgi:hypothetical protein